MLLSVAKPSESIAAENYNTVKGALQSSCLKLDNKLLVRYSPLIVDY